MAVAGSRRPQDRQLLRAMDPLVFATGDFNGDGIADLAVGSLISHNGDHSCGKTVTAGSAPGSRVTTDRDGCQFHRL